MMEENSLNQFTSIEATRARRRRRIISDHNEASNTPEKA